MIAVTPSPTGHFLQIGAEALAKETECYTKAQPLLGCKVKVPKH
jgi:hypothetical protein